MSKSEISFQDDYSGNFKWYINTTSGAMSSKLKKSSEETVIDLPAGVVSVGLLTTAPFTGTVLFSARTDAARSDLMVSVLSHSTDYHGSTVWGEPVKRPNAEWTNNSLGDARWEYNNAHVDSITHQLLSKYESGDVRAGNSVIEDISGNATVIGWIVSAFEGRLLRKINLNANPPAQQGSTFQMILDNQRS